MKKLFLLIVTALLVGVGAQAKEKTITLTFANDAANGITWNAGTNTVSDGNKITFSASWSHSECTFSKPVYVKAFSFDSVAKNTELTFEFHDSNGKIGYACFFGKENAGFSQFDIVEVEKTANIKKIKSIKIDNRDGGTDVYAQFETIKLTIVDIRSDYKAVSRSVCVIRRGPTDLR